ncbi:glycerophosphodiester phosphodiesterase family protein [Lacticaseibacillus brantae]|uniref:GP-PDE domain-containing protein n=1 Tax=Lacticaseibacillus brantae DSM 23927 TaxID=1423727 RepID=A0A0R2B667_9LACO|nr:glycerophosphodiester phosphodiesterase family protein [Lacticaseibacillus brantae]KRM71769.1 hypothetical protein FC34_GL001429 [Lacticaseibacillus brantae DSM 23927]
MKKLLLTSAFALIFILASGFTVIGHRGETGNLNVPEHTFASYDRALADGANYIEQDLVRSADGTLVVSHDYTTSRMAGQAMTITQTPWSVLSNLRMANGEKLHSLDQVFAHYASRANVKFVIETRAGEGVETSLVNLVNRYGLQHRVIFESFSLASLNTLKHLAPAVPTMYLLNSYFWTPNYNQLKSVDIISNTFEATSAGMIANLHQHGKQVMPWQWHENPSNVQKVLHSGVDGIFTDYARLYKGTKAVAQPATKRLAVKTKAKTNIWTITNGKGKKSSKTLAKGSTWKAFGTTLINGQTFYSVGGNQWINQANITIA